MNLKDVEALALELMDRHGLIADGWNFEFFTYPNSCAGRAEWRHNDIYGDNPTVEKCLGLNSDHMTINDEPEVREVILHEITHALLPHTATINNAPKNHGYEFKQLAKRLGATGLSCCPPNFKRAKNNS